MYLLCLIIYDAVKKEIIPKFIKKISTKLFDIFTCTRNLSCSLHIHIFSIFPTVIIILAVVMGKT